MKFQSVKVCVCKTFFSPVVSPKSCHHSLQSVPRTGLNLSTYKTFDGILTKLHLIGAFPLDQGKIGAIIALCLEDCICSRWRCRSLRTAGTRKPIFSMERKLSDFIAGQSAFALDDVAAPPPHFHLTFDIFQLNFWAKIHPADCWEETDWNNFFYLSGSTLHFSFHAPTTFLTTRPTIPWRLRNSSSFFPRSPFSFLPSRSTCVRGF